MQIKHSMLKMFLSNTILLFSFFQQSLYVFNQIEELNLYFTISSSNLNEKLSKFIEKSNIKP